MTAHPHSSASSNFIYHYSFHHKISWTTWRREPERLQWESLPTVRELLKHKPTRRQRPVRSVLSEGAQHRFQSQGWQWLCYGAVLLLRISQYQTSAWLPLLFLPRNVSQASLSAGKEGHSCVHLLILAVSAALKFCRIMRDCSFFLNNSPISLLQIFASVQNLSLITLLDFIIHISIQGLQSWLFFAELPPLCHPHTP